MKFKEIIVIYIKININTKLKYFNNNHYDEYGYNYIGINHSYRFLYEFNNRMYSNYIKK